MDNPSFELDGPGSLKASIERVIAGICATVDCGKPRLEKYRFCAGHLEPFTEIIEEYNRRETERFLRLMNSLAGKCSGPL